LKLRIRDLVEVTAQPTVVRLDHLQAPDAGWISSAYYVTEQTGRHFKALKALFAKDKGCGVFLIGHYGSGKSHFLAYLTQQLRAGSFGSRKPQVLPVSLLNYRSSQSLEDILAEQLPAAPEEIDRRRKWAQLEKQCPKGIVLILDELSEFLRSKPSAQSFNEDLRFLQFLGEWAQDNPLWIVAALQEQIEHTGEIEYDLFRKIKDRYPIRLLLTPAHVKDLISEKILRKKDSYRPAVEKLAAELSAIYPKKSVDYGLFCEIYPIHPATLEFLEEVRDRFSQSRGIVDFTLTQLLGNEARNISPFLDQPWGHLLTPDAIVDHFSDLFEVQPEFLTIAQKVLPYFRKQVPELFESRNQQELAWQLLKLLILVHLSPRRNSLSADEASVWLLYKISSIDPARNRGVVKKTLETLSQQAAFIKRQDSRYRLDLEDDSKEYLEQLLSKTVEELKNRGDFVFENLVPLLEQSEFNPFALPRDRWFDRKVRWHFHDWDLQVYFGTGSPKEAPKGTALQIGIPWNTPAAGTGCYKIIPKPLELDSEILELSALLDLKDRPLPARVLNRVQERISARTPWFCSLVRNAYSTCSFVDPRDSSIVAPIHAIQGSHTGWLNSYGEWILRQTYPLFEQFAPGHGPLPKEAYRQFMKFASEHDLGIEEAPEYVKLIREAYLVPMSLMQRRGSEYVTNQKLDNHDLVRLLAPLLDHQPTPERVYQHLSAPVYGLVPDQIHLLLIMLLIQGEIDIVKGDSSYREAYETLIYPLQYDRILPGRALTLNQLQDLQTLCEGLRIPVPRQWSVLAQKRAIDQLRKLGVKYRDQLGSFATALKSQGEAADLVEQAERVISQLLALEKGEHELQGFQHFLFAIGSPRHFASELNELLSMPARFERLLRETRRYRHLFGYPAVSNCVNEKIAARIGSLGEPPPLAEPEALDNWLREAQRVYQDYRDWYQAGHETLWKNLNAHRIWNYRIPGLARSRHFAGSASIREIEDAISAARAARCQGLGSLDFQPMCRCGFDGSNNPLQPALSRFEEASGSLDKELAFFFQQDEVKAKVKEWTEQRLELNDRTLAYLEGKAGYPEVENMALFDQHLAGVELVHTVEAGPLLELLSRRVWEKGALIKALEQHLDRFGPRISFRVEPETPPREGLAAWCCEQALTHACPLPRGLSASERAALPKLLQPQWVSEESLLKLDELDLGESVVLRVIEMLLNGSVRPPVIRPESGIVAAALDLMDPKQPDRPEALMNAVTCLYEQSGRLTRLRPQECLSRLEKLAETRLEKMPEDLNRLLQSHMDDQWVVVDCLGLPLVKVVHSVLSRSFAGWKFETLEFSSVSKTTSTEAFYLGLIGGDLTKPFEKINAVDALIHNRRLQMKDLAKLAEAELEVAFRKIVGRLDRSRPILIYGDHGFRMTLDGAGFTHGGSSTLERITPVFRLIPL
jgi:hypothetical protein